MEAKKNEDKIKKVQANIRGFLQRKNNKIIKAYEDPKPQLSHRSQKDKYAGGKNFINKGKIDFSPNSYVRELSEMPDYSNQFTK